MPDENVPQSPEEYPEDVREELDQTDMTHVGEAREDGDEEMDDHMGARETETTSATPPMTGPSKLTKGTTEDMGIEPREELTGG
ncbi:MAG: hypothetical protein M3220_14530 [Chloroflexota bacterium]|nr:hypothetical protein [Chloroflexota bacterium]